MKENKHLEFIKSIRLPLDFDDNGRSAQTAKDEKAYKIKKQEEYDLQKELERRFNELFGTVSED